MINIKNKLKSFFIFLLIIFCVITLYTEPEEVYGSNQIVIDVRDADIRDVLSAMAIKLNVSIVYIEEPLTVTFKAEAPSAMKLFELLLYSNNLSYIIDDKMIIVGYQDNLSSEFFDKTTLTRFDLQFIETAGLVDMINLLNIPVDVLSIETNPSTIWVQGTPQSLNKVKELITAVDMPENIEKPISLEYREVQVDLIKPERVVELLEQSGIDLNRYLTIGHRLLVFDEDIINNWEQVEKLIRDIDDIYARDLSIFVFHLNNTAAYHAKDRLEQLGLADVIALELHYDDSSFWSDMSKSLLIATPPHMEPEVRIALANIDRPRDKIRTPIARGDSETRMRNLRDLLVDLSGVPKRNFNIFTFSRREVVLWVEETPENVKLLEHLIDSLKDDSLIFDPNW